MISLPKTPQSVAPPRQLLGAQAELVELATGDAPLGGDELGGDALVHQALGVALGR